MRRWPIGFWTIYTLGFTVVLPTFLYYHAEDLPNAGPMPGQSAATSFLYLGIGVVLWLIAIICYLRFYLRLIIFDKKDLLRTLREGTQVSAKILARNVKKIRGNVETLELKLSFINLSGTAIEAAYELNDARPAEKRFEPGNSIELRVRDDGRHIHLLPDTAQVSVNLSVALVYAFFFLLILLFAIGYLVLSYRWESQGYGWRFLKPWHPWILVPAINLVVVFFGRLFLVFVRKASGSTAQSLRWILYGVKATATLLNYKQTGLSINDQPQVQFEMQFTDRQGAAQNVTHKEIVSLLDLHRLNTATKEILYLPDNPHEIIFYESLSLS